MGPVDFELEGFQFVQFSPIYHFSSFFKGQYLGIYFSKKAKKLQAFYYSHRKELYTILSKSEGVSFQISFFWGDLIWNDPDTSSTYYLGVELSSDGTSKWRRP